MIRTALTFHRPGSLDEAAAILAEHGEAAAVLGGGTVLVPRMTSGDARHEHLVDPVDLGLARIEGDDEEVRIGARVTYAQLLASERVAAAAPLLMIAAGGITGGGQLRNQGTIGGSACFSNPSSDMPAVLVALAAKLRVHGPGGERTVPAGEFFRAAFEPDLRPGELLAGLTIPASTAAVGYFKLKLAEASWPIVTAAAVLPEEGPGHVTLGGVCPTPRQVPAEPDDLDVALRAATAEPWSDLLAPGDYRRDAAPAVVRKAITQAEERSSGGGDE